MSFILNEPLPLARVEAQAALERRRMLMLKTNDYTRDSVYISPYELYHQQKYAGPKQIYDAQPITVDPSRNSFTINAETSKCSTWCAKWCSNFCACYRKDSNDTRCCGLCYRLCPSEKTSKMRYEVCTNGFWEHCRSGYIYTDDAGCNNDDDSTGCYCIMCFPFKLGIFSPCLLGSIFNSCLNNICKTNTNYLF